MSTTSLGGVMLSRSITPCGSTSRTRSGKTRVKASAMGKLMSRTLGFRSNELIVGASGNPAIHTTSTLPSLSAATVAPPPKGSSVAVVESTPLLRQFIGQHLTCLVAMWSQDDHTKDRIEQTQLCFHRVRTQMGPESTTRIAFYCHVRR